MSMRPTCWMSQIRQLGQFSQLVLLNRCCMLNRSAVLINSLLSKKRSFGALMLYLIGEAEWHGGNVLSVWMVPVLNAPLRPLITNYIYSVKEPFSQLESASRHYEERRTNIYNCLLCIQVFFAYLLVHLFVPSLNTGSSYCICIADALLIISFTQPLPSKFNN